MSNRHRSLWLICAVAVLAGCGGGPTGDPVRFTVARGSGFGAVSDTLVARGIIGQPRLFRLYARATGADRAVKPGVYELQRGTEWEDVLNTLRSGRVLTVQLTIPEGWTIPQVATRIGETLDVPVDSVLRVLTETTFATTNKLPGPTAEGYLYPATYAFPVGTPLPEAIRTLTQRYQKVWTPQLRARADSLGMTEREVVTLASIVEKEAKVWAERDTISAVYHNRLRIGMPLQADPTVQYARGEHEGRLLYAHIDAVRDHPYNTYTHRGLPPGPIASPSAGAIRAVLGPAQVDYLYFVANPDGTHTFTRTLREHNAAKRRSRRALDRADAAGESSGR